MPAYWDHLSRARLSRRRVLASAAAGGVFAAASLVGCGGDEKQKASSLLEEPVDTSSRAQRGGMGKYTVINDTPSFAPIEGPVSAVTHAGFVYSRLLKYSTSRDLPGGATEPDASESFEVSSDGLQYTFRLRGN